MPLNTTPTAGARKCSGTPAIEPRTPAAPEHARCSSIAAEGTMAVCTTALLPAGKRQPVYYMPR
jgi:hypothetical protein